MAKETRHTTYDGRNPVARRKAARGLTLPAALLLGLSLLAGGCTGEDGLPPSEAKETTLQYTLTRSAEDEGRVTNARMAVFNRIGNQVLVNTTTPKHGLTFEETVPAGILNIYLVANELPSWNLGAVLTPSELKGKVLPFSAYPVVDGTNDIPMLGSYENHPTTADIMTEINDNTCPDGTVERLYAKVSLDLSCAFSDIDVSKIILDKVRIRNLPTESYLYPAGYSGSTFFDGADIVPSIVHGYDPANNTGFSHVGIEFYIPEYVITDRDKYSYLSIVAYESGKPTSTREYTLPIGDSIAVRTVEEMKGPSATLADLRISRNTHYQFTATIKAFNIMEIEFSSKVVRWGDTGDIDLTTGNKQLEANSYVLEPGGDPALIPVSRANAVTAQLSAAEDYEAEIVWMEKWDGSTVVAADMGPSSPVRAVRVAKASNTDITKNYILVTPGTSEGNAVVAVRKASAIVPNPNPVLWSWHVWVTSGKDAIWTGSGTGNRWMDRPLGMLPNNRGLYYQWGRKDAFPHIRSVTPEGSTGNWGDGSKTVYDPCPPGWRVPSGAELKAAIGVNDAGFPWTAAGRNKASAGGFYPAMGWITTGYAVLSPGTTGKYWHGTSAEVLSFDNTVIGYAAEAPANKCAVRCIKE